MPRYELRSESTVYTLDGERKEAVAVARFIANTNRETVWITAPQRSREYVTPANTTPREFIHAVRRAIRFDDLHAYSYEVWVKAAYKGQRRVSGALGYFRMMQEGRA